MAAPSDGEYGFSQGPYVDGQGNKGVRIYSALDSIVLAPSSVASDPDAITVDPACDLVVEATTVGLVGSFELPQRHVTIIARRLEIGTDSAVTLDVSGRDRDGARRTHVRAPGAPVLRTCPPDGFPPDPFSNDITNADWGVDGDPGTYSDGPDARGPDAGSIVIVADEIDIAGSLALVANGGRGLPGEDGMDGTPGADGSWETDVLDEDGDVQYVLGQATRGGRGGNGGDAATGSPGGNAGTIVLHGKQVGANKPTFSLKGGPPGAVGWPGDPGKNGESGGTESGQGIQIENGTTDREPFDIPTPKGGDRPTGGDDGHGGHNGASHDPDIADVADLEARLDAAFLLMLLQQLRARMVLSGPPADPKSASQAWTDVGTDLAWLADVLAPAKPSDTDLEAERKALIAAEVRKLHCMFTLNRSVDCRPADWAPMTTFESLDAALTEVQDSYDAISTQAAAAQQNLDDFVKQACADATKRQDLAAILATARATTTTGEDSVGSLFVQLQDSDKLLDSLQTKLKGQADAIAKLKSHFNCNIDDVFHAAEMIAFAPQAGMALTQAGELLYNGFEKIPTLNGVVDKNHVFEQLTMLGNDLVGDARTVIADGTQGELGYLKGMITTLAQYRQELENVQAAVGPAAKDALATLDLIDKAITARGSLLARYNAAVQDVISAQRAADLAQAHLDALAQQQSGQSDPMRTGIAQLLSHELQVERERLLGRYLAARRAWSFRFVADPPDDDEEWMPEVLYVPATTVFNADAIMDKIRTLRETEPDAREALGPVDRVPSGPGVRSDVRAVIDDPQLIATFKSDKQVSFTLGLDADPGAALFKPLNISGKANIHVFSARPRLLGLSATRAVIMTTTQGGVSNVIAGERSMSFEHPSVEFDFTWDAGSTPDWGSGGGGESDISGAFILPALLGPWTVTLTDDEANAGIDLGPVTAIEVEFGIEFNHGAPSAPRALVGVGAKSEQGRPVP